MRGETYQESYFYTSPTFFSPITINPYISELTNFGDPIDISSSLMPKVEFRLSYKLSGDSKVYLFASNNALGPYKKVYTFKEGATILFREFPFSFHEFTGSKNLFVKFVFVKDDPWDFFSLGTPTLLDLDVENYSGDSHYSYVQGTSFSAPIVAAVASMIFSHRPDLLASDVKKIILDSVQPLSSLNGKVLSGGSVRADYALAEANNYKKSETRFECFILVEKLISIQKELLLRIVIMVQAMLADLLVQVGILKEIR